MLCAGAPCSFGMAVVYKLRHDSAMVSSIGLSGKSVLVTRASTQMASMRQLLASRGAIAVSLPCLDVADLPQSIKAGLDSLDACSDVLFTSANGVQAVATVVAETGQCIADLLSHQRVAAVGKQTASALAQWGVSVDIVPATASQDGLIDAYQMAGWPDSVLFFRAKEGRDTLRTALANHGVKVVMVPAYQTVCPDDDVSDVLARLKGGDIDAVLLGSAKTALHYVQRVGSVTLANQAVLVAISEKMAVSARKSGLNVQVVAKSASFEAMLDALAEYFNSGSTT